MTTHGLTLCALLCEQIGQIKFKLERTPKMTISIDLAGTPGRGPTVLCRELIKEGTDPEELVKFTRGTTPVFAATPVQWWAARRVREADAKGPMRLELVAS